VPGGHEICERQLFSLIDKMKNIEVNEVQIEAYLEAIYEKFSVLSREDLIKRFVSVEFNRFLAYYENARDLNDSREDRVSFDSDRRTNFTRFFINIGARDKLNAAKLMGIINEQTRSRDLKVGRIDIMNNFSFFEIDKSYENDIVKAFEGSDFNGMKMVVELSKPDAGPRKSFGEDRGERRFDRSEPRTDRRSEPRTDRRSEPRTDRRSEPRSEPRSEGRSGRPFRKGPSSGNNDRRGSGSSPRGRGR